MGVKQYDYVKPPHQNEANPSQKILKLGKKITDVIPHKFGGINANDPEYWGLRELVTDEMADIGLLMKLRKEYTFEQLVQLTKKIEGMTPIKLQSLLNDMCNIGILEYDYGDNYAHDHPLEDKPKVKRYRLPFFVPGSAELFNSRKDQIDAHPAIASFFERMTYIPLAGITHMLPEGGDGVGMHVIPVEKSIQHENGAIDIEKISHWLDKYEGHLSAGICSCRYSRAALDEGCADDPDDWCIQVGDMADYVVETGKGRRITREEAMEIFQRAEDNGYVHQITNIDGDEHIFAICNCNLEICNALRTSQLFNTPNMSRSAYTASVDPKNCVACGRCVEYCPAGAVRLGQKLCLKDGSEQKYPKEPLPDNFKWGEFMWHDDYRDRNRINCYDTGTAPCKTACPAHIAIQGYLKMASQGRYDEALALIKKENPFPAVCGRVCNKRCEEACTRGTIDQAVAIDAVKKFIAQRDLEASTRYIPEPVIESNHGRWHEKIAIIGAGPAGLSCAFYLAKMGYNPTVFEKNALPGGMMTYGIPSYKLEKDVLMAEIDIIKEMGVEIKCNCEVGKDISIQELKAQGYKAFYIAIGCQGGRLPGVPGQDAKNTYIAVDFLKEAFENQEQKLDGNVIVIGGGNVAIDCARTAHRFGATSVSMYALESKDTMPASKEEIFEAEDEKVIINNQWGPKEILKDENGNVKGVVFKKCTRTIDPATGKFSPEYDENQTITVDAKYVIFAIGQSIVWGDLLKDTEVTFHHGNYPLADNTTYQTADPDIFVGGDVYTGPKFVIDAIGAGHEAAELLHRYVRPHASLTIGLNRRKFIALDKENISVGEYDKAGRQEEGMDETIDYRNSFRDAHKTLTEEQVKIETSRCLGCGASVVDENRCIGCGVCTTKCEFDAIHLFRTHPNASKMVKAEKKYLPLLKNVMKRGFKIAFGKKDPGEKAIYKARKKAWKETQKQQQK